MPLSLDIVTRLTNVHWGGEPKRFLYSGADGMFGSEDGEIWKPAPSSVAAISLAWVDNVWVAAGPDGCWRSDDGAKTWAAIGPQFKEVAAMTPEGSTGGKRTGVFAGWFEDDDGENQRVYISVDLGKTWSLAKTIPTNGGTDDGFEGIQGLSGAGGALFICTIWQSSPYHHGDGKIYSSIDGHGFLAQTVFGPGNVTPPEDADQYPRKGFTASAVGYDAKTATYIAVGEADILPALGELNTRLIYTISSSPSFGTSEGNVADSGSVVTPDGGQQIGAIPSAAGGDGKHVTGSSLFNFGLGVAFVNEERRARFIPGGPQVLETSDVLNGSHVGSFCFKSSGEVSTDGGDGIFACTAFGADNSGGAYVTIGTDGTHFVKTHSGTAIVDAGRPRGAVAVGNVGFL